MLGFVVAWVKDGALKLLNAGHMYSDTSREMSSDEELAALDSQPTLLPSISEGLRNNEVIPVTASEMGYAFQQTELCKLTQRLNGWKSVKVMNLRGDIIYSVCDMPRGKDGGIDAIIVVTTPTERGSRQIIGRIIQIMKKQNYGHAICRADHKGCRHGTA